MDDVVRVRIGQCLADLLEDRHEPAAVGRCVGSVFQRLVEGLPLDELHGQEGPAIGQGAEVVDWRDRRVLQLAGDARFAGKAERGLGQRAEFLVQHLHRDFSAENGIGGAVNDAHAATFDLLAEDVALGGGRLSQVATKARGGVHVRATDGLCWVIGGSRALSRICSVMIEG